MVVFFSGVILASCFGDLVSALGVLFSKEEVAHTIQDAPNLRGNVLPTIGKRFWVLSWKATIFSINLCFKKFFYLLLLYEMDSDKVRCSIIRDHHLVV